MKLIRLVLGKVLLFLDHAFSPTPVTRAAIEQKKVDEAVAGYSLYQFAACPFCIKVRRRLKRLNLKIPVVDILKDKAAEQELITGGGKRQVPCLRIKGPEGAVRWMYESSDIINHLNGQFGA